MKAKPRHLIFLIFLLVQIAVGQFEDYAFRREIGGVTGAAWQKIVLPDEIFGKVSMDFSDLRIIGVKENNETVEVPFFIRQQSIEAEKQKEIEFRIINRTQNSNGFYFTFELPKETTINQIALNFANQNFDWKIRLEGGQNQSEWFTVAENYRILSIKNNLTDYAFSTLNFPNAKFRYFRLFIPTTENPDLISAKITEQQKTEIFYKPYQTKNFTVGEDKKLKQTVIDIELPTIVPVSFVKINVRDNFDFYRPLKINYSVKNSANPNDSRMIFSLASANTLSSLETKEFKFNEVRTDRLQIVIENQDNQPLNVDSVEVKGKPYEVIARFTPPYSGKYYLTYSNKKAVKPNYDIGNFKENIPVNISELVLGEEQNISKTPATKPLIQSPVWLWAVIISSILLLGWFSLKMLRNKA